MNHARAAPSGGPTSTPTVHPASHPPPPPLLPDSTALIPAPSVAPSWLLRTWGFLTLRGNNYILPEWAIALGYGRNVKGKPTFFASRVNEVQRAMDYTGVASTARSMTDRTVRLTWLLEDHAYLPDRLVAELSGYSVIGVKVARRRIQPRDRRPWRHVAHPDDLIPVF